MDMPTFEHDEIVEFKGIRFRVKFVQTVRGEKTWKIQANIEATDDDNKESELLSVIEHLTGKKE